MTLNLQVSHTYGIDIVQPMCVIIDGLQPRYLIEHIYLHKNKKNAISPLYPLCSLDSSPSNSSCKVCLSGTSSPHSTLEASLHFNYSTFILCWTSSLISQSILIVKARFQKESLCGIYWASNLLGVLAFCTSPLKL